MKLLLPLLVTGFFLSGNTLTGQTDIAMGEWKSYLPYVNGNWVAQSESKVYFATEWSLAVLDKADHSFQRISKVEGLSQVGIELVQFNKFSNTLLIVYTNSVIDLVKPEGIFSLFDIANSQSITGDKEVYHIFIVDENTVYISANYGLSKLDLKENKFPSTTFTGMPVASSAVFQDKLYMATEEGIYRIALNSTFPEDFSQWEKLDEEEGFPAAYSSTAMTPYNNQLYFTVNDTLFRYDGQGKTFVHYEPDNYVRFLTSEGPRLIAGYYCTLESCSGKVLYFSPGDTYMAAPNNCDDRPIYAVEDANGNVWFADAWREFRFQENGKESCDRVTLNAPYSNNINQMYIYEDELWIASGGVSANFAYLFRDDGFFSLIDGNWSHYNRNNRSELTGLFDFYDLVVHPENGNVYVASFLDGLVEFDRESMTVYNYANSSLNRNKSVDTSRTRVSGLAFDQDKNLWISNHNAERPFSVFRADGTWKSFAPPACIENQLLQVIVDRNNYKWFVVGSSISGILIFDEGDPDDPNDDRCRLISSNNSNLPSNKVNCLAMDLDGDIWVGTEQGVIVFECGDPFDAACIGSLRTVLQDNFGAYLLETENVRTIAVDGANRKWFGTDNGIFVQSPDGMEQVAYFHVDNSPLFDNTINDIVIHPVSGEVFIGTNKGLQSVRYTATEGGVINSGEVKVFPNPVRPDYDGVIAVNGLARDADIKITDMSGQLVYATKALGGQAIWDGRDYNGRKAATGVYLVYSTSPQSLDNPNAIVARILFIN